MYLKKKHSNQWWIFRFILYGMLAIVLLLSAYYIRQNQPPQAVNPVQSFPSVSPVTMEAGVAFPGAEGFGSSTPGGRYGRVIFVSNLNDTKDINNSGYEGSLRWALEHTWPENSTDPYSQRRIIVFRVGGVISLVDRLILIHPYVTIAGQTAPGDGITLKGNEMIIATHDVVVRGIRIRVGDQGQPTCCLDGLSISTHYANIDVYNIIIDHSSISWAIDENLSTWRDPEKPYTIRDITVQWSIISEGLHNSIHLDEGATETDPHSMGAIFGQDGTNMTVHHNIFAHNWARNPRISGIIHSEIINNVIYGWGNAAVEINQDKNITHVLNNYFKAVEDSRHYEITLSDQMHLESQVYISGNLTNDLRDGKNLMSSRIKKPENFKVSSEDLFVPSNVTMSSAKAAYADVLNYAGVIYPVRDRVDVRIINDVKTRKGNIIDSQIQVGGWPNYRGGIYLEDTDNDGIPSDWETAHGLNPAFGGDANDPSMLSPNGYSWIEEYINSLIPFP